MYNRRIYRKQLICVCYLKDYLIIRYVIKCPLFQNIKKILNILN